MVRAGSGPANVGGSLFCDAEAVIGWTVVVVVQTGEKWKGNPGCEGNQVKVSELRQGEEVSRSRVY